MSYSVGVSGWGLGCLFCVSISQSLLNYLTNSTFLMRVEVVFLGAGSKGTMHARAGVGMTGPGYVEAK